MIFGVEQTPAALRLYGVRFGLENAEILKRDLSRFFVERQVLEELAPLDREKFFKRGLRLLGETSLPVWDWSLIRAESDLG